MSNGASPFNWAEYIEFAKALIDNGEATEAAKRSAISRSYYGAFILARNLAANKGWVTVRFRPSDHKNIKNYFKNHETDETMKIIGHKLDRLRGKRNKVDYNNICNGLDDTARYCITLAEFIKEKLNLYR